MPIYEYSCAKCGTFEVNQSISEDPLKRCPQCRAKVTKLISASAFHLKGGGWYADAYQKKSSDSTTSSGSGSKSPAVKAEPAAPVTPLTTPTSSD
ncbi:MAG: zinc ribbon domain-containing protein [Deltaproteobacteria bacterium]|nr:zinc ribbon domain-containing protein [Deltaproteobacteria bacterium]